MLPDELKADVLELAAIAKECPEGLREKCFDLLLTHYLKRLEMGAADAPGGKASVPAAPVEKTESNSKPKDGEPKPQNEAPSPQDITAADIHIKARKFLEKYGRSLADLNQVFYKEGGSLRPLYEDLKTTKTAESQLRIALLQALICGLTTGDFQFDGEEVRKECQTRKCYDVANFSANFKNNSNLFDGFEKYDKQASIIKLSDAGREQLAKVISELV
jgi:hypothetical protein